MKPKINEKVYTIWGENIILETVEYLGEDSFLIQDYENKSDACYDYSDYDVTWFRNLDRAKKRLLKKMKEYYPKSKIIIEQTDEDMWEAYEDEKESSEEM